ncbi:MAG: methyltransferase [Stenotrophomonas rhizophila]|jgi:predicted methyltransferase|uniref:Methyltransferase n=1 Tax=Stenotrophomonas rhizophila TaxID=216778 RepID=A0AAP5ADU2_9GAMM|nr:class I SAM-dependent methyltransferase [Stenotrophomonas rhizophila]MDF2817102.1 methyltransferase [Stenotrophomonas rhizophila]MDQ1106949.1 putative methyltransferase [Stenotrophomonas rhizophila]
MKARSLSCACLFTVSTLLLAAPAMAIKPAGPNAQPAITAAVQAAVDGKGRTPDNVKRDAYRHPAQTLSFFGVEPGKTVVEITPGGGWYSEILAPLLRDKGTYVAAVVDPMAVAEGKARDYQQRGRDGLEKKFAGTPSLYDKAKIVGYDPKAPKFGPDNSADVVLTFRNVHNWRSANQAEGMFKGFYSVLKPGGVLGVVEHRAKADVPADDKSGYVGQAQVIAMAEAAGFKLAGSSEINANPRDTKDHPNGVWTLPPVNNHDAADDAKYKAIGESDRMTLRFVK